MYKTFTRTFWKEAETPGWPNNLEPCAGERDWYDEYETEAEALAACKEWNKTHNPGRYSRKMEYEEL